jgi:hypothetical protein
VLIAATSTEYLHIPVTVPAGVDTGETPVQVAVVSHRANPDDDEWHPAEWDDAEVRIMIGPGTDIVLAAGDYRVWINIDPPGGENVVRKAGVLSVT